MVNKMKALSHFVVLLRRRGAPGIKLNSRPNFIHRHNNFNINELHVETVAAFCRSNSNSL
jgi:hypothetical protein